MSFSAFVQSQSNDHLTRAQHSHVGDTIPITVIIFGGMVQDSTCLSEPPSTSERDSDDFDFGAFIDRANQSSHGQSDHGTKQINRGKVIGNTMAGDIRKTCGTHQNTTTGDGYFNTRGSFAEDRWTQLTLLVNIMTHTTFPQSTWSFSSAVLNPLFSSMSKRAGESFATSASAKQKPIHCSGLIARKTDDKNTDMDYHAVSPPKHQAGGDPA